MRTTLSKDSKAGLLIAAWLLTATILVHAEAEDRIKKSFAVAPGGTLIMEVDRGSIDVRTTDGNGVEVEVIRRADAFRRATAEKTLAEHSVELTQQGNDVRIRAEFVGRSRWSWLSRWNRLSVRYLISVPKRYNADLQTAGGSMAISNLDGQVKARTSGGSLRLGNIAGPVWGKTSGGSIALESCKQPVDVQTSGGSLNIGDVEGSVVAKTAGGSIRIKKAKGEIIARTSGGSIDLQDVSGKVDASTSGGSVSARLTSQPPGDCSLRTSGGSITVKLAGNIAANLDARTSGGRVVTDIPVTVQGEISKRALKTKLNGGGPALILVTSGGNVHIRRL